MFWQLLLPFQALQIRSHSLYILISIYNSYLGPQITGPICASHCQKSYLHSKEFMRGHLPPHNVRYRQCLLVARKQKHESSGKLWTCKKNFAISIKKYIHTEETITDEKKIKSRRFFFFHSSRDPGKHIIFQNLIDLKQNKLVFLIKINIYITFQNLVELIRRKHN